MSDTERLLDLAGIGGVRRMARCRDRFAEPGVAISPQWERKVKS